MVIGIVLMVVFALALVISVTLLSLRIRKLAISKVLEAYNFKKELTFALSYVGIAGISFMLFFVGVVIYNAWIMTGFEWFAIIFGGFFTPVFIITLFCIFRLHYWQKLLPKKLDTILYWIMISCIPLIVLFIWLFSEGMAMHLIYPLPNGLRFDPFGLVSIQTGHPNIAWYALCILSGAIYVYFICDHFMFQKYGKHGLVESTFFIAFPAGIIGARIAYVIGNWNVEFAGREWWKPFAIWEGGLTILGGAIVGIIVGCLWFKWRHKDLSLGESINIIVPTILIAQAVGRWGNFFNCEVHGFQASEQYFMWLPTFIREQAKFSSESGMADPGNIFVPLFLIEGIVNILGYYVLAFVFGRGLKKYVKPCDLAFGYVTWYGLTRTFMEPLRDPAYNMGSDGGWSWYWSIVFIGVGLLAIIVNHIIWHFINEKKEKNIVITSENKKDYLKKSYLALAITSVISLAFFITGMCLFFIYDMPSDIESVIALVPHNFGVIFLVIGSFTLPSIALPIICLIKGYKIKETNNA